MRNPYKSRDLRWEVPKWLQNFESAPLWPLRYLSVWNFQFHTGQISNGSMSLLIESTSHTPLEDRQARLSGVECGYPRRRRDNSPYEIRRQCASQLWSLIRWGSMSLLIESTSHSQLGGRGACSPDEESANHRRRRYISPWCILYIFDCWNFDRKLKYVLFPFSSLLIIP